jgi:hypothetical protein
MENAMRRVRLAIAAATRSGEGRKPSSTPWCSESEIESKPRSSAKLASSSAAS